MNYAEYKSLDVVNGEGTRCSLFVSGCEHNCKGCFNSKALNPNYGKPFTTEVEDRIIADLNDTRIKRQGISLLGGDPLYPANLEAILKLCKRIKSETEADIWLWTGYRRHEAPEGSKAILEYVDVLIDGKFEQDLYDPDLLWRGSSNQNVIYLEKA